MAIRKIIPLESRIVPAAFRDDDGFAVVVLAAGMNGVREQQ